MNKILILVVYILISFAFSCKKVPEILELPTDREMITWNDSIFFKSDPFTKRVKSVVYLRSSGISEIKRWIPYIEKYPEVGFIFYFSSSDKDFIVGGLEHFNFPIPVFIDTENKFKNYGLIAFVINDKDEIISVSNPTIPDFEKTLKKLSNLKK
ncbi:MAG: hypothetical protein JXR82_09080 [Marinifilaceae bacterium]|nr:hypothetical protein [Marinifilaceae bacterium]